MSTELHPALNEWVDHIEGLQWSALIVDAEWRLVWASTELEQFLDADESSDMGYGRHLLDALMLEMWQRTVEPAASLEFIQGLIPYVREDLDSRGVRATSVIEGPLASLVEETEPSPLPFVTSGSFVYVDPRLDEAGEGWTVDVCMFPVRDASGDYLGAVGIFFIGVRPNLLALLGRGNQEMYERMARLVVPSQHRAAILFCDLAESGKLSRELSNSAYFKLVRNLWTGIDEAIAEHTGIVGKHAGDGATAYFLVTDVGSKEAAAVASLRASRAIHQVSETVFGEFMDSPCRMKVGVHWAGSLYMGQLVPGGRLEVTALGDEVNETARLEASAEPGQTLVSKHLLQQLGMEEAARLGIDLEKVRFTVLADMPGATEKVIRDAGSLPATRFE